MPKFSIIFSLIIICLSFTSAKSQQSLSPQELENLLDKAEVQSQNYSKVFQNLSAEELKTKSFYKPDGGLDEKRVIKSVFIVYQSPNTNNVQEFRNVLEFNGKTVVRDEKEIAGFFEKLAKAETSKEEYEKLRKESLRYDGRKFTWGITLMQPRPFRSNIRSNFKFQVIGKEQIEGRDAWIIEYEQIAASPHILSNPTSEEIKQKQWAIQYNIAIPDAFRPTNPLIKGIIRLDAETAQIWRNEFKVILNPKNLSAPIVATEQLYEYQSSRFGILVPKRISLHSVSVSGRDDKTLWVKKDFEAVYEYSKFNEFKSEAKDYKPDNK